MKEYKYICKYCNKEFTLPAGTYYRRKSQNMEFEMLIVNTLENYNGEKDVSDKMAEKNKILIESAEASLLCQNRILAKLFWADREEQSSMQVK